MLSTVYPGREVGGKVVWYEADRNLDLKPQRIYRRFPTLFFGPELAREKATITRFGFSLGPLSA